MYEYILFGEFFTLNNNYQQPSVMILRLAPL